MTLKTVALVQGDPGGIGPELLHKLLSDDEVRNSANLVVIGAPEVFARGDPVDGQVLHLDLPIDGIGDVPVAQVSAAGGQSSIEGLRRAFELSQAGKVDGIVFMPFNKESMHLGGNEFADELGFARSFFDLKTPASEFNVANGMWNGRVTSHVAMKDVPDLLTTERIEESIGLTDRTLKMAGHDRPRIVVAAYNPHAGDGRSIASDHCPRTRYGSRCVMASTMPS